MSNRDRWRVLPFNPYFQYAAAKARESLGLPARGLKREDADEWRSRHRHEWVWRVCQEIKPPIRFTGSSLPFPTPPFELDQQATQHMSDRDRSLWAGIIRNFFELNPLRKTAISLQNAFELPPASELLPTIEGFIITGDSATLETRYIQDSGLIMVVNLPGSRYGPNGFINLSVFNVDRHTTWDEWRALWTRVKQLIEEGLGPLPRGKRPSDPLKRDLIWWQWRQEGKTYKEIADKWMEQTHEAEAEDTIRFAVNRVDELMRPLPQTET